MVFLRSIKTRNSAPALQGELVTLRLPGIGDFEQWRALRSDSAGFLKPWEPTWPQNDLTRSAFQQRIKRYHRDIWEDVCYPFFVFERESGKLAGGLTLSNIRRGVAQCGSLGYWLGEAFTGRGLMTDAVSELLDYAFDDLALHRIEAACLPMNRASRSLLERCGFTEEGFARQYLKINGEWRDHVLFAILRSDRIR